MFRRVDKIPLANTFSELVEMVFVDYGDYAAFLHIQDSFSLLSVVFTGAKKRMGKLQKWYVGRRFRIGWRCLGRLELL